MIRGACHCGGVHWRLDRLPDQATVCNCTVCRRYGALWAYGFEDEDIRMSGETRTYAWGARNIDFHFCGTCGCVTSWWAAGTGGDGRRYGAVNLRMSDPETVAGIPVQRHDGLGVGSGSLRPARCVADLWS